MKKKPQIKRHPLTIAISEWSESAEGKECRHGVAQGVYLENRLLRAFRAGWFAKEKQP
jgi:hypothetical protein